MDSDPAQVMIQVDAVNDLPVANPQSLVSLEDTDLNVTLSGSDADGDMLEFAVVVIPAHGSVSGDGQQVVYTPNANYFGDDSFIFRVSDGLAESTAAITITVQPVNDPPVAQSQTVTTEQETALPITLVAFDVEGDPLTFAIETQPQHGSLAGSAPNVVYTADAGFTGIETFTFSADDGHATSAVATVTINVNAVGNTAPIADDQMVTTSEEIALAIDLSGSDADDDPLTYTVIASPQHGQLSGDAPNLVYTPAVDYFGDDSFTFAVNDGTVDSNPATVWVTVEPVNDAPVALDQGVSTLEDSEVAIVLQGTDVEGDPLSFAIADGPTHGVISGQLPNATYTPENNYFGTDTFTFVVNDGEFDSAPATVTISIEAVNDPPTWNDDLDFDFNLGETITIAMITVLSDPDGDDIADFTWEVSGTEHLDVAFDFDNGLILITVLTPDWYGLETFVLTVADAAGQAVSTTLTVTVQLLDGDTNQDGAFTVADVDLARQYILGLVTLSAAQVEASDFSGDGLVDMMDVIQAVDLLQTP